MKRIFFFTCVSSHIHHWRELLSELDLIRDVQITVYHFDSINAPDRHPTHPYQRIKIVDFVTANKSYDMVNFLRHHRPDTIVVLDKGSLLMRSVLLAANHLGIHSVQTQHGLLPDLTQTKGLNARQLSKRIGGKLPVATLLRNLRKITLVYTVYANTYRRISRWFPFNRRFLKYSYLVFRDPKLHNLLIRDEVQATRAFCFGRQDLAYFTNVEGYPSSKVRAVGKPEFANIIKLAVKWKDPQTTVNVRRDVLKRLNLTLASSQKIALLISQPIAEDGLFRGFDFNQKIAHLENLCSVVESVQHRLVVKLHPREDFDRLSDRFKSNPNIHLVHEPLLNELISVSNAVLGYYSTALINAVLLGKHPLILDWVLGDTSQCFPDLEQYRVGTRIKSIDELPSKLITTSKTKNDPTDPLYKEFYDRLVNIDPKNPPAPTILRAILHSTDTSPS